MAGDPFKIKKNKVPIKKIDTQRVLALDAATNITGYAIYDDGELVSYGTYKAEGNTDERINKMKKWLVAAIDEWEPDFVGIENV
jgi:tRNA A37 threonylcarbamoyladenosine modification protein TsaB